MTQSDIDFLQNSWVKIISRDTMALKRLAEIYFKITGEVVDLFGCTACITKTYTEISKHVYLKEMAKKLTPKPGETGRKYVLKPGNHSLVPGGTPYNNLTLTDELAEYYVGQNPNLRKLFDKLPD